jgi:deoxyadenosine/deoxycytidine kinase
VGKTSVLEAVSRLRPTWKFFPEPVDGWQKRVLSDGRQRNFLKEFYDDPREDNFRLLQVRRRQLWQGLILGETFSFFQSEILLSLLERYRESGAGAGAVILYERSLKVLREIFLEERRDQIRAEDFTFLHDLSRFGENCYERDVVSVYLSCSDQDMLDRIRQRGRKAEEKASWVNEGCQLNYSLISLSPRYGRLLVLKRKMDEWATRNCVASIETSGVPLDEVARRLVDMI